MKSIETKIEALMAQVNTGKLNSDKIRILAELKRTGRSMTEPELCDRLNMLPRTVAARLSDLQDAGVVIAKGTKKVAGTRRNKYSFVFPYEEQVKLARIRERERYEIWRKRGLREFAKYIESDPAFQTLIPTKTIPGQPSQGTLF